tara:strand:- start:5453 stop:5905 length:453 start_codon:yes stop_codon:yes gene_type:complete
MNWENILSKSDIRKGDFKIAWTKIPVDDVEIKNKPKELTRMLQEEGYDDFDTVDIEAGDATVNGYFTADIRTWGVKSLYSYATDLSFVLTLEDTEGDLYKDIDITVKDIEDEDDDMKINPREVLVEIDMKGQSDPSQFDTKATIVWQGSY